MTGINITHAFQYLPKRETIEALYEPVKRKWNEYYECLPEKTFQHAFESFLCSTALSFFMSDHRVALEMGALAFIASIIDSSFRPLISFIFIYDTPDWKAINFICKSFAAILLSCFILESLIPLKSTISKATHIIAFVFTYNINRDLINALEHLKYSRGTNNSSEKNEALRYFFVPLYNN